MSDLAMGTINRPPPLCDGQDRVDLDRHQTVHRMTARSKICERADIAATGPLGVLVISRRARSTQ